MATNQLVRLLRDVSISPKNDTVQTTLIVCFNKVYLGKICRKSVDFSCKWIYFVNTSRRITMTHVHELSGSNSRLQLSP